MATNVTIPKQGEIDKLFELSFTSDNVQETTVEDILNVKSNTTVGGGSFTNSYSGNSVIVNSDRLIFNAKSNHLLLCGKEGVTVTSPSSVHIDCDDDIYLFSEKGEIYLGLPGRGNPKQKGNTEAPKTKGDKTKDADFEPLVLGLKLANLLEDLISLLHDIVIRTGYSDGIGSNEFKQNIRNLQGRVPEILSTVAFIDGISHEQITNKPEDPKAAKGDADKAPVNKEEPVDPNKPFDGSPISTTGPRETPVENNLVAPAGSLDGVITDPTNFSATNILNMTNPYLSGGTGGTTGGGDGTGGGETTGTGG